MTLTQKLAIFGAKYVIFFLLTLAAIWFLLQVPRAKRKEVVIFAVPSVLLTFLLSLIAAKLYMNPRPFVVGHFTPLVAHGFDNGFPSDHTLLSAVVSAIVWRYNRVVGAVLFGLTILVGLSRVYVGVHHLIDIIGAIVIAVVSTLIVYVVLERLAKHDPEPS